MHSSRVCLKARPPPIRSPARTRIAACTPAPRKEVVEIHLCPSTPQVLNQLFLTYWIICLCYYIVSRNAFPRTLSRSCWRIEDSSSHRLGLTSDSSQLLSQGGLLLAMNGRAALGALHFPGSRMMSGRRCRFGPFQTGCGDRRSSTRSRCLPRT